MRKLKSLKEFQAAGLGLERSEQVNFRGGAETSYYKDTTTPQSDCQRCAREDNPNFQTEENKNFRCVYKRSLLYLKGSFKNYKHFFQKYKVSFKKNKVSFQYHKCSYQYLKGSCMKYECIFQKDKGNFL